MKRREFLKSSLAATSVAGLTSVLKTSAAEQSAKTPREFYELRLYHLRRGPKQKLFDDFYREASIPAMNRAGIGPIGVFNVAYGPDSPTMYVLIPHKTIESFGTALDRVRSDADYQKAGAGFINAPATDPSYVRVDSSLMVAFAGMPELEMPASEKANQPRLPWATDTPATRTGERIFAVSGLGASGGAITQGFVADVSSAGIQHSAPIGPSFQGGPLLNSKAEVLAIGSRAYSPLGFGTESVFFGVPIRGACDKILRCPGGGGSESQPGQQRK